jgi:hypothetical protein
MANPKKAPPKRTCLGGFKWGQPSAAFCGTGRKKAPLSGAKVINGTHTSLRGLLHRNSGGHDGGGAGLSQCASISVVYHDAPNDNAAVMCGGCGMFLSTRGQFRQLLERQAVQSRLVTTGC